MSASEYPPAHHALRDLPFELEVVSSTEQRAHLDGGAWSVGALATVLDVLCGSLCAGVVAPDWMATSTLTLRLAAPVDEPLVMAASVLRAGRRSVTIETTLQLSTGELVGDAVLSFSRLERRGSNLDLSGRPTAPGTRVGFGAGAGLDGFERSVPSRVLDAADGRTETDLTPYVRNSFGALNGGVVAALAARAALLTAPPATEPRVDELAAHHLGQGRHGPVRTTARTLLVSDDRRTVRVELRDHGEPSEPDGRLMAVVHVGLCITRTRV